MMSLVALRAVALYRLTYHTDLPVDRARLASAQLAEALRGMTIADTRAYYAAVAALRESSELPGPEDEPDPDPDPDGGPGEDRAA